MDKTGGSEKGKSLPAIHRAYVCVPVLRELADSQMPRSKMKKNHKNCHHRAQRHKQRVVQRAVSESCMESMAGWCLPSLLFLSVSCFHFG
jgi:hypothetical protein